MGSDSILGASDIEKQAKEIIIMQAENLGRAETHTNACTNKINCATCDIHI